MRQAGFQSRLPFSAFRIREKTEYSAIGWSSFASKQRQTIERRQRRGRQLRHAFSYDRLRCQVNHRSCVLARGACAPLSRSSFAHFERILAEAAPNSPCASDRDFGGVPGVRCDACSRPMRKTAAAANSQPPQQTGVVWRTTSDPGRPDSPGRSSPTRRSSPMPRMTRSLSTSGSFSKRCLESCWPAAWRFAPG